MRLLSRIKSFFVRPGSRPMSIHFGIAKGIRFYIDPACKTQRLLGLEEAEIASPILSFAKQAKTIADIGANDGYYATVLSARNRAACVIAVDPDPKMRELCLKNLELNGMGMNGNFSYLSEYVGTDASLNCVRLDSLLENAEEPICIKIDR